MMDQFVWIHMRWEGVTFQQGNGGGVGQTYIVVRHVSVVMENKICNGNKLGYIKLPGKTSQ